VPAGEALPADPEAAPDPGRNRPLRRQPQPVRVEVAHAEVPDGPPAGMVWRRLSYRFVKAAGPERIGPEWGNPDFKLSDRILLPPKPGETERREVFKRHPLPDRDYYIAEDANGHRFWLFRADAYGRETNPAWFLHGVFA
jgi:protein ImuB